MQPPKTLHTITATTILATSRTLQALCLLALSTGGLSAQGLLVFDDFNSSKLDTNRWIPGGKTISQANSRLRLDLVAVNKEQEEALVSSLDGFHGDFDLVLDFDNLVATNTGGDAGFALAVSTAENPIVNDTLITVEVVSFLDSSNKRVYRFDSWLDVNGTLKQVKGPIISSTVAGQVRLTRKSAVTTASTKLKGQTSWKVLTAWAGGISQVVDVEIFAYCGDTSKNNAGKFTVDFDKLSYSGKRISGRRLYGTGCHDLVGLHNGFPFLGNKSFGIVGYDQTQGRLANSPMLLIIGFSSTPISLTFAGAPGCFLNTDILILLGGFTTNKQGHGFASLPIPNDPRLVGASVNMQVGVLKNVNNFGYALSNGVKTTFFKR